MSSQRLKLVTHSAFTWESYVICRWGSLIEVREEGQVTVGPSVTVEEGHLVAIDSKALNSFAVSNASWQEAKGEVVAAQVLGGFVERVFIPCVLIKANEQVYGAVTQN